jgi:arginyl-tRNA synthetase
MQPVPQILESRVQEALASTCSALSPDFDLSNLPAEAARVVPCGNPQFGDYQWNGALSLAKLLRAKPRDLATKLIENLDVADLSAAPEIAGPGFVNFRLKNEFLSTLIPQVLADARVGVPATEAPRTIVIDYPSPNVAKPLHVGHIRTMFIGDAIARTLRFMGHSVVSDNHIGDWGTPIGMVIWGWKRFRDEDAFQQNALEEMGRIYKIVKAATLGADEQSRAYLTQVREETALLQGGDEENLSIWRTLREASQVELDAMYERLGIRIDETLGESFYNDRLAPIVEDLQIKSIARESEGAEVIFFDRPEQEKMNLPPMIVRKSDGGFNYASTDLATVQYRMEKWQPSEIIYVVDSRQALHFRQLFEASRMWGFGEVDLRFVDFGTINGEDGRAIKTREGDPPKLTDLLDEAQRRALEIVRQKNPELSADEQQEVARVIGIGSIKYADLSQNRASDYVFSWGKMLALQGNSAPYLLFAYVRVRSIFRKAGMSPADVTALAASTCTLEHPRELALAKYLLRFHEAIETALSDYRMNAISDYLFELAQEFSGFIEACRVLDSEEPARTTRLILCALTANVLKQGLDLLGIESIERM